MQTKQTIAVVGGDFRQVHIANLLAEQRPSFQVYGMFLDKEEVQVSQSLRISSDVGRVFPCCDVVIFPLPVTTDRVFVNTPLSDKKVQISQCLNALPPGAIILAGRVPACLKEESEDRNIEIIDYLEREELAVLNAIPTAEGALEIAIREMPTTIFGQTCLISGFGRIGKVLAKLLVSFGAKVKVVARKYSDLAWIRVYGCEAIHVTELGPALSDVNILFNTVPAMLFDKDKLLQLPAGCLVIDLASKPGGVDFETAKSLGIKTIWALSLPGKTAPITAGEIILDTINNILKERGIFD